MIEWLKLGALLLIFGALGDIGSELTLLREEIAARKHWKYLEDDVE